MAFVAHSDKRDGSEDKDYRDKIQHRRIFAGAKGVGRFSCDRLGSYLNLITLKKNQMQKLRLYLLIGHPLKKIQIKNSLILKLLTKQLNQYHILILLTVLF